MAVKSLATLRRDHNKFIALARSKRASILAFNAPCCFKQIETLAAPKGRTWDSLNTCPHCGSLFMKITTHDTAIGRIPPETR